MSEITRFNKQPHFPKLAGFSPLGAECTGGGGAECTAGGGAECTAGGGAECTAGGGAECTAGRGYGGTNADKTRVSVILNRMRSRAGIGCFGMLVVNVIIDGTFSCGSCTVFKRERFSLLLIDVAGIY